MIFIVMLLSLPLNDYPKEKCSKRIVFSSLTSQGWSSLVVAEAHFTTGKELSGRSGIDPLSNYCLIKLNNKTRIVRLTTTANYKSIVRCDNFKKMKFRGKDSSNMLYTIKILDDSEHILKQ